MFITVSKRTSNFVFLRSKYSTTRSYKLVGASDSFSLTGVSRYLVNMFVDGLKLHKKLTGCKVPKPDISFKSIKGLNRLKAVIREFEISDCIELKITIRLINWTDDNQRGP